MRISGKALLTPCVSKRLSGAYAFTEVNCARLTKSLSSRIHIDSFCNGLPSLRARRFAQYISRVELHSFSESFGKSERVRNNALGFVHRPQEAAYTASLGQAPIECRLYILQVLGRAWGAVFIEYAAE